MRTCKPIDANYCLFIVTTSRPKASWKSTCGRIPGDAAVAGEDGALTEHGEATREAGPRWRRMAGASGPRAAGRAGAPRSPSRCRRRRRRTAPRPSPRRPPGTGGTGPRSWWSTTNPGHERRRGGRLGGTGPRSWWSTTTRTRGARCATLAAAGYAPATAAGPGEVARLVAARQFALAVLDLVPPGVDGIQLVRTLPALAGLPAISRAKNP